ncbi:hypothetical protein TL16_g03354 [Triparma laevis f. inornata]|uniref:Uncharacterized protein n=1 Tax=Triparma laevis f. inornata TaxID=1714386 RepID=A0A9W7E0K4_9STRA|nr:hypothetical protein TL16_g03354 [Triparma laevis f. inornata]
MAEEASDAVPKGREISEKLMIACCNLRAPTNIPVAKFLKKLSHLNLNDRHIDTMAKISVCKSLKNLYLYNNHIRMIEGIDKFKNLTHLYLENNKISQIEGLPEGCLQKLYLNENDIEVIENLDRASNLTELHVASQRLPPYQPLRFSPSVIDAIASSLLVLNIANNNIDTVVDVLKLPNLEKLNMSRNKISSIDMCLALMQLSNLRSLDLRGNPASKMPKYTENLIANSPAYLSKLDGKDIIENHRTMLKNLVAFKSRGMMNEERYDEVDENDYGVKRDHSNINLGGTGVNPEGGWGSAEGALDYVGGEFR